MWVLMNIIVLNSIKSLIKMVDWMTSFKKFQEKMWSYFYVIWKS